MNVKLNLLIDIFCKKAQDESWALRAPDHIKKQIQKELSQKIDGLHVFIVWPEGKWLENISPQEIVAKNKELAIDSFKEEHPDVTVGDVENIGTLKDVLINNGWIKDDVNDAKNGLKPAADSMMKGKTHPWQHCYNKMKGKVSSPEAFCAKMKDVHKGTTEWRSTEGLKNKKKDKSDKSKADDDMLLALDYSDELAKSFIKANCD